MDNTIWQYLHTKKTLGDTIYVTSVIKIKF